MPLLLVHGTSCSEPRASMTLEEPKKQIADDESEMMEVKHA